jgi:hypothetical protein
MGGIRGILTVPVVFLVLACAGCNSGTPEVAIVRGKVMLNGKPLTTGQVATLPAVGKGANGLIQSDGSFELSTFGRGDGATIGTHKAIVVAYQQVADSGPESGDGKLLVPKRYVNPEKSGLQIEVKSGEVNELVLELTSP